MPNPLVQRDRLDRTIRGIALGVWLTLTALIAVKTLQNPNNHNTYPIFHEAARAWWQGTNVYDTGFCGNEYRYGPSFALAISPLAWLPLRAGAVIWMLFNIALAYAAIVALCRCVLPGAAAPRMRNLVLIAAALPAVHCLYAGQTNLLIFALVAFAGICLLDGRWWFAALLLAAAAHIKVWPLAAGLLLAACWPRRLAWRLPLALLAVAALPLMVKSPVAAATDYVQWFQNLVGPDQIRHAYRDAWTIWELAAPPVNARLYALLQLATAAATLGLCVWQSRRLPAPRLVLFVLAVWASWQLVFGPGTERNTFALIAPLTGWAVVAAFQPSDRRTGIPRAAWLMAAAYGLTVVSAIGGVEDITPWLRTLHPFGIVLFFAWFLRWNYLEAGEKSPLSLRERVGARADDSSDRRSPPSLRNAPSAPSPFPAREWSI